MIRVLRRALPALLCLGLAAPHAAAQPAQGQPAQAQPRPGGATKPAPAAKPAVKPAAQGQGKPAAQAPAAPGSQGKPLETYDDWAVYATPPGKERVCYALSKPKSRHPSNLKDIPGYLFVATRPAEKVRNEISLIMNFDLKESAEHQALVGQAQVPLVAKGRNLWVKNPAEERRVIDAMRRANDVLVKGVSAKNNATQDKYSLKGFGDALDRVQKECR
jgi:hypothetical protein